LDWVLSGNPQLKQISDALNSGELKIKPASSCTAEKFVQTSDLGSSELLLFTIVISELLPLL
jgi:hypothetical protein